MVLPLLQHQRQDGGYPRMGARVPVHQFHKDVAGEAGAGVHGIEHKRGETHEDELVQNLSAADKLGKPAQQPFREFRKAGGKNIIGCGAGF